MQNYEELTGCKCIINHPKKKQTLSEFNSFRLSGNAIIMGSSTAFLLGLTWGGVRYEWSSARVITPIVLGLMGILAFMIYEAKVPEEPTVPWRLLSNRTTISG